MIPYRSAVATILLLLVAVFPAQAETLSIDAFETRLIATHPAFTRAPRAVELETEVQRGLLGAEDWRLSAEAAVSHLEPSIALFGPEETNAFSAQGMLECSSCCRCWCGD